MATVNENNPTYNSNKDPLEPIYFMDLSVANVRCFGETVSLDLSDGNGKPARWTVILGDNGTGKTTLLQCLVGMEPELGGFWEEKEKNLKGSTYFPRISRDETLLVKLGILREKITYPTIEIKSFFRGSFFTSLNNALENGYFFDNNSLCTSHDIGTLVIYAYGASRRMGEGSVAATKNKDAGASLFNDNTTLLNAEAWLLEMDYAIKSTTGEHKEKLEKRYVQIKETLKQLLPDVLDFRLKAITETQTNLTIEVETPYGWVDLKSLSLGYKSALAWMVDVAARQFERYPNSDNPLGEPAIVLVDEIDLHLHPKWQRTLMKRLSGIFTQTQFIVTSHSPLIVQAVPDANVIVLKRINNQIVAENNPQSIRGWRIDQIMTSDLFDIESVFDEATIELMNEYEKILLQNGTGNEQRKKEIEKILNERLGVYADRTFFELYRVMMKNYMKKEFTFLTPTEKLSLKEKIAQTINPQTK